MPMIRSILTFACCLVLVGPAGAQEREQKVRDDRKKVEAEGFWIYNDFARGVAEAKRSGKPLVVVLRCIPCVECVKLDDDLVDRDPRVRPLLEQFVCVRLVSTNGLNLSLFQFDYDQSFAVFFLNADGTIYGRFGTRSHRTQWSGDVSIEGLASALQGALALHKNYPNNREELAGKRGLPPEVPSPEKYAVFRGRYESRLNYDTPVVRQCIHCHQIGDAQRQQYRERQESIPEKVLFPYPHPKAVGLIMDPHYRATVHRVEAATPAAEASFEKGDVILKLAGQPLLSIADVQWVLQQTDARGGDVRAEVRRGDRRLDLILTLKPGWRQRDDISWRATTWELRRMATGGMLLEAVPDEERSQAGLPETGMALKVRHVGQYPPHDAAKQAGFRAGDVIVALGKHTDLVRETDFINTALREYRIGQAMPVALLRGGKRLMLDLPVQP
jgi:hypothetical protein